MSKETHQISDIIPADSGFSPEGEISLGGQFTLNQTHSSTAGDLFRTGFEMTSDFGHGSISMLGKQQYSAILETYLFKQGMICSARLNQPFIGLYFQMEGSAQSIQSTMDFKLNIQQGESNLMIIPPMNESFELKEELSGNTFTLLLSYDYLLDLSCRFPHLLEPVLDKLKKKDFCHFREQNVRVSPRMRGAIQRIQNYDAGQIAGSLFLEAQILDLLGLFFSQPEQSASSNGHPISRLDQERIHRAKDILLERMEMPPTLAELSRLVGSNEFKLKRGFKELFGTSPYAYLLQQKLERARTYILDTELTIGEIAYLVGYSDPAHLTHAFRKQYGIRPSDLR